MGGRGFHVMDRVEGDVPSHRTFRGYWLGAVKKNESHHIKGALRRKDKAKVEECFIIFPLRDHRQNNDITVGLFLSRGSKFVQHKSTCGRRLEAGGLVTRCAITNVIDSNGAKGIP